MPWRNDHSVSLRTGLDMRPPQWSRGHEGVTVVTEEAPLVGDDAFIVTV